MMDSYERLLKTLNHCYGSYESPTDKVNYNSGVQECKKLLQDKKFIKAIQVARCLVVSDYNHDIFMVIADASFHLNNIGIAQDIYRYDLAIRPLNERSLFGLARCFYKLGDADNSREYLKKLVAKNPSFVPGHLLLAHSYSECRNYEEAIKVLRNAKIANPKSKPIVMQLVYLLKNVGELDHVRSALEDFLEYSVCEDALIILAAIYYDLEVFNKTTQLLIKALELNPLNASAHNNLANAYLRSYKFSLAENHHELAIEYSPQTSEFWECYANTLVVQKKYSKAQVIALKAVEIDQTNGTAFNLLGLIYLGLHRASEAITYFEKATTLLPKEARFSYNLAVAFASCGEIVKSIRYAQEALGKDKNYWKAWITLIYRRRDLCDWKEFDFEQTMLEKIPFERDLSPFAFLNFVDNPRMQLLRSRAFSKQYDFPVKCFEKMVGNQESNKIRLGYFSGDFYDHPTMRLMIGMLEHHSKYMDVYCFDFGEHPDDEMTLRVKAVTNYIKVSHFTDSEIVAVAREKDITVAIDINGYAQNGRPGIFALRAAAIQVAFLGYPSTTGAPYMDYLIADRVVIPESHKQYYSEKIIYLPDCYQPNDLGTRQDRAAPARKKYGLPEKGFVFACFNQPRKITPIEFGLWLEILNEVKESVLWLWTPAREVMTNLKLETKKRGIDEERIVCANTVSQSEHLERIQLADLFLDCFSYNAHTTASDCLKMSRPIITKIGEQFASRVAASCLLAAKLPELVTHTPKQYKELAIYIGNNHDYHFKLIKKMQNTTTESVLFNTVRFTENFEALIEKIVDERIKRD